MAKETVDIGKLIDEETKRRLEIMESSDYEWPKKAGRWNWIAIIAAIVVCIVLIVLCMTEVIV